MSHVIDLIDRIESSPTKPIALLIPIEDRPVITPKLTYISSTYIA